MSKCHRNHFTPLSHPVTSVLTWESLTVSVKWKGQFEASNESLHNRFQWLVQYLDPTLLHVWVCTSSMGKDGFTHSFPIPYENYPHISLLDILTIRQKKHHVNIAPRKKLRRHTWSSIAATSFTPSIQSPKLLQYWAFSMQDYNIMKHLFSFQLYYIWPPPAHAHAHTHMRQENYPLLQDVR